jgi:hypothetical protein
MVHLSPLVSPAATWQGESSTPPPWQTEGPRGDSAHGGLRAGGLGYSCAFPFPRREFQALPGGDATARSRVSFLTASSTPIHHRHPTSRHPTRRHPTSRRHLIYYRHPTRCRIRRSRLPRTLLHRRLRVNRRLPHLRVGGSLFPLNEVRM